MDILHLSKLKMKKKIENCFDIKKNGNGNLKACYFHLDVYNWKEMQAYDVRNSR